MNTTSSSEDDDPLREPRAYNNSIYLMAFMPYALLGAVSFFVYRGFRKARKQAELLASQEQATAAPPVVEAEGIEPSTH